MTVDVHEEWRPIPGWDTHEISNYGRIRRGVELVWRDRSGRVNRREAGGILKTFSHGEYGHQGIRLRFSGRTFSFCVHRMVLLVFVGPPPDPSAVTRHLDGNPRNNYVGNLAWGTHQDNSDDMIKHGTRQVGSRVPSAKLTEEKVIEMRKLRKSGLTYQEIADNFGMTIGPTYFAVTGQSWGHVPKDSP